MILKVNLGLLHVDWMILEKKLSNILTYLRLKPRNSTQSTWIESKTNKPKKVNLDLEFTVE
jgi:hypothetical protein